MVSPEKTNWLYDYVVEDVAVPEGNFSAPDSLFSWSVNGSSTASVENDFSFGDSHVQKELGSKKRARAESCAPSSYKARREKLRRDKMNDKFMELSALLDPGRPPKTDKAAILLDNTFAPMVMSPARLGADVVIHSISKYISGGADIIAGREE